VGLWHSTHGWLQGSGPSRERGKRTNRGRKNPSGSNSNSNRHEKDRGGQRKFQLSSIWMIGAGRPTQPKQTWLKQRGGSSGHKKSVWKKTQARHSCAASSEKKRRSTSNCWKQHRRKGCCGSSRRTLKCSELSVSQQRAGERYPKKRAGWRQPKRSATGWRSSR